MTINLTAIKNEVTADSCRGLVKSDVVDEFAKRAIAQALVLQEKYYRAHGVYLPYSPTIDEITFS